MAIMRHHHRNQGLVLSELGSYLLPAYQPPARTKRLSRLLHSPRRHWQQLPDFFSGVGPKKTFFVVVGRGCAGKK